MRARTALGALVLGAVSFGLGVWSASPRPPGALDLDESSSRIRSAMLVTQRLEQVQLIAPVLRGMQPGDATQLAQVFESTFASGGGGLPLELFVERWASLDPEASRERIASWPPDARRQAWPVLLGSWARRDPRAASEALGRIEDPAVRRSALAPLMAGWGAAGDTRVWQELAELPEAELRRELADSVVQLRLQQQGSEALLAELDGLPDAAPLDRLKGIALASTLARVARDDLPRAVALAQGYWDSPYADEILRRVATQWAAVDGSAAIEWLRAGDASEARDRALVSAYRRWLQADRTAATRWIEAAAGRADAAPLLPVHAAALARDDPRAAIEWAGAIRAEGPRRRAFLAIGRVWRRSDAAAAGRWLESVGLAEAVVEPARN